MQKNVAKNFGWAKSGHKPLLLALASGSLGPLQTTNISHSRRPVFCILAHRPCVDADGSKLRRQFVSSTSTATTTNYLAEYVYEQSHTDGSTVLRFISFKRRPLTPLNTPK